MEIGLSHNTFGNQFISKPMIIFVIDNINDLLSILFQSTSGHIVQKNEDGSHISAIRITINGLLHKGVNDLLCRKGMIIRLQELWIEGKNRLEVRIIQVVIGQGRRRSNRRSQRRIVRDIEMRGRMRMMKGRVHQNTRIEVLIAQNRNFLLIGKNVRIKEH